MHTPIEIGCNVIALLKLPLPVKELAGMIERLETIHGAELRMTEHPKSWLQFFKPDGNDQGHGRAVHGSKTENG